MNHNHRLTDAELDQLSRGLGDREVVRRLRAAQVSKRLLQLRTLLDALDSAQVAHHHDLFIEAERRSPGARAVLAAPHTGAWLASALRDVRGTWLVPHRPIAVHLRHFGALAVAAALRAGLEFKAELEPTGGVVMLPGLGSATVGAAATVTVSHIRGEVQVGPVRLPDRSTEDGDGWLAQRRLTARAGGLSLSVCLDDLDPYRDCHRLCAADRLDPAQAFTWQRLLQQAWEILVAHHRPYAEAIAEGLVTIVPLNQERANVGMNVTSMDSFGAVSLTEPADGRALALGLLHEFQHAKLGALLDLVPLYHRDDEPRYYAPWRDDPRPLGAALQGVYAFLGVADFWRVQRQVLTGGPALMAEAEFVHWRDRVLRTLDELAASGRFTAIGVRFLEGLSGVHNSWRDEAVSAEAVASAVEAAEDHWVGWRLRNRRPDPASVRRLADLWRQRRPCPAGAVPTTTQPQPGRLLARSTRLDLARLRLTDPERFAGYRAAPETVTRDLPDASPGDVLLAHGDHAAAQQRYRSQILAGTDALEPWIGLALAGHRATPPGEPPLLGAPELCLALHRELTAPAGGAEPVDPMALARWLLPASTT